MKYKNAKQFYICLLTYKLGKNRTFKSMSGKKEKLRIVITSRKKERDFM